MFSDTTLSKDVSTPKTSDPVWDLPVRIFHWALVATFSLLAITGYLELDIFLDLHVLLGLVLAFLLIFRLLWGIVGPKTSRFSGFPLSISSVKDHMKSLIQFKSKPYQGHTPMGAWMILAMLGLLSLMVLSGLVLWGSEMPNSPLAPYVTYHIGEFFEEIHELAAGLLLGCVALHVSAIVLESKVFKHPLIEGMISGHRDQNAAFDPGNLFVNLRALVLGLIISLGLFFLASALSTPAHASSLLETYKADAPLAFSVKRGQTLFETEFRTGKEETPACTSCHGTDPRKPGETRAGKHIDPMAKSIFPERYSDPQKVEKWFRRNCKSVLGRPCTAQEKGDFLAYMMSL